jgi:hypothetical protein
MASTIKMVTLAGMKVGSIGQTSINQNLFEFADTVGGSSVAILPSEDAAKMVSLGTVEKLRADETFEPEEDLIYSQSPKAGTLIERGSKVNLVLVAKDSATVGMLTNTHKAVADATLVQVYDDYLKEDEDTTKIVEKYAKGDELEADEIQYMEDQFTDKGITLVEGDLSQDFNAGMNALAAAFVLGAPKV